MRFAGWRLPICSRLWVFHASEQFCTDAKEKPCGPDRKSPAKRGCSHRGTSLFVFVRLSDYCRIVVLPILVVFFFDFGFLVFIIVRISRRHCRLPFAIAAYSSS